MATLDGGTLTPGTVHLLANAEGDDLVGLLVAADAYAASWSEISLRM